MKSEKAAAQTVDYSEDVFPILKRNCIACHFSGEPQGGLNLESFQDVLKGGDSGESVLAHNPADSLLYIRAASEDADDVMPPPENAVGAERLSPAELDVLKRWIEQGAAPGNSQPDMSKASIESIAWQPIPESMRGIYSLSLSPNGRWIACSRANRVMLYDLQSRTMVDQLADPTLEPLSGKGVADVDAIQSVAFSPDGMTIATAGYESVRLWRQSLDRLELPTGMRTAEKLVVFSPDCTRFATLNVLGDVEVRSVTTGEVLTTLNGRGSQILDVLWPSASEHLFIADQSGTVRVLDASKGKLVAEQFVETGIRQLAASSDGKHLAILCADGKVQLLGRKADAKDGFARISLPQTLEGVGQVAIAGDVTPFLVFASQEEIGLMDINQGKEVLRWKDDAPVTALLALRGGKRLLTGNERGAAQLWSIPDGKPLQSHAVSGRVDNMLLQEERAAARQSTRIARLEEKGKQLQATLAKEEEALSKVKQALAEAKAAFTKADEESVQAKAKLTETGKALNTAKQEFGLVGDEANEKSKVAVELRKDHGGTVAALEEARKRREEVVNELNKIDKLVTDLEEQARIKAAELQASQQQAKMAIEKHAQLKGHIEQLSQQIETHRKAVEAKEKATASAQATVKNKEQALASANAGHSVVAAAIPVHQQNHAREKLKSVALESVLGKQRVAVTEHRRVVKLLGSPDGNEVIVRLANGNTCVIDVEHGTMRAMLDLPATARMSYYEDSKVVLVSQGQVEMLSVQQGWEIVGQISNASGARLVEHVSALAFHPNGRTLAVSSGSMSRFGIVQIYDVDQGTLVRDFDRVHSDTVLSLSYSPSGTRLASAAADKTVRVLDPAGGEVVRSLEGHSHHVISAAWRDDEQALVSASADQTLKVWEPLTGQQRRTIGGFAKEITAVAYVETSNQVVTVCGDGQVRVYDSDKGSMIRSMNSGGFLQAMAISLDGKWLLSGDDAGALRIWDLQNGKLVGEFH